MSKPRVVIIIPTYNEADNVGLVARALHKVFAGIKEHDMHILFVDDSSPDHTGDKVRELMRNHKDVHLLINKHKGGLGAAYKKGMQYALGKLAAEVVFEFDADLSHDPTKIPQMLAAIEAGADLVLGSRYIKGGGIPTNWGWHRKFLSVVGNLVINIILYNFSIRDWTTGYRAIRAKVVRAVLPELSSATFSGYTWQIGFLVKTFFAGYAVVEVPFVFVDRERGQSKLGPEYLIRTLRYIVEVRIEQLMHSRVIKFLIVGGFGALVQFVALYLYRQFVPYQLAFFLAIETAVLSNFTWSNLWTFADRKLSLIQIPAKFVQFNLASAGSILIQQLIALVGENTIGLIPLFTLPVLDLAIDTGMMYAVVGILVGMFWNFFAYSKIVWKKK